MRLELDILNIKDVQFADKTIISDGVLYVDRHELQEFLQEDRRLSQVGIELAHPGEKCRILQVSDVIEPRAKTKGSGEDFPGALGKQGIVGEGSTRVLRGVTVATNDYTEGSAPYSDPNGEIVDMFGPAAEIGTYGKTHNVVVLPSPANGVGQQDYRIALKIAGLKTAVYLAQAGRDVKPDDTEVYDLPALAETGKGFENLPKVAYIFSVLSSQFRSIMPGEPILYGGNVEGTTPMILHPNEVLDGAVVAPYGGGGMDTCAIQNHAMIKELYRRHRKELCFAGVIITIAHTNEYETERAATMAANLARGVLGVDGVILTKSRGGFPEVDMARTAQRCEERGVRTVLSMWQWPADVSDLSLAGVIFNFPEVNAVVSMGTPWATITLPPVERIIGRPIPLPDGRPASGKMERPLRWIKGTVSHLGNSRLIGVRY